MTPIQFAVTMAKACGEDVFKEYIRELKKREGLEFGSREHAEWLNSHFNNSVAWVLSCSFGWSSSQQGHLYWRRASDQIHAFEKQKETT